MNNMTTTEPTTEPLRITFTSSDLIHANIVNICRRSRAADFNKNARDEAMRVFMFASTFPSLTGEQILALARDEGTWDFDFSVKPERATFTFKELTVDV